MNKNRKELKIYSLVILLLVALSLTKTIIDLCLHGLPKAAPTEGLTQEVMDVIAIIVCVFGFIIFIPQIYVGLKGLFIANGADGSGKLHKILAIILAIFALINVISSIASFSSGFNVSKLLDTINAALDVVIFAFYFYYARKIA
jgi:hypothetical protein